jgi:hypothetical protein
MEQCVEKPTVIQLILILLTSYGNRVLRILSMDHALCQLINPVRSLAPYFFEIRYKITPISAPPSSIGLFSQVLTKRIL